MSREIDTTDASALDDDEKQYAVQRDLLTLEQLDEIGLDSPEKVAAFLAGDRIDPADRPYSGNHMILSDEEIALIERRREEAEKGPLPQIKVSSAVEEGEGESDYESMTNDDLRAELASRNLSVEGRKAELIERLQESDASQPA